MQHLPYLWRPARGYSSQAVSRDARDWNNLINVWHCCPPPPLPLPAMTYLKQTAFLLVSPFSFQGLVLWRDRLALDFTRLHMHRLMIFTAIDLFYALGQLSLLYTQMSSTRKAISMVSPRCVTFSSVSFNCYQTPFSLLPFTQKRVKR